MIVLRIEDVLEVTIGVNSRSKLLLQVPSCIRGIVNAVTVHQICSRYGRNLFLAALVTHRTTETQNLLLVVLELLGCVGHFIDIGDSPSSLAS